MEGYVGVTQILDGWHRPRACPPMAIEMTLHSGTGCDDYRTSEEHRETRQGTLWAGFCRKGSRRDDAVCFAGLCWSTVEVMPLDACVRRLFPVKLGGIRQVYASLQLSPSEVVISGQVTSATARVFVAMSDLDRDDRGAGSPGGSCPVRCVDCQQH